MCSPMIDLMNLGKTEFVKELLNTHWQSISITISIEKRITKNTSNSMSTTHPAVLMENPAQSIYQSVFSDHWLAAIV